MLRRLLLAGVVSPTVEQLGLADAAWCQRWTAGRASYRPSREPFDPAGYQVHELDEATARGFVTAHHYSRSYPAARLRYGLLAGERLVRVAVIGEPMSRRVTANVFPTLGGAAAELSRLVLLDEVLANAETWFMRHVRRGAAGHGLRGLVAFSDPLPRHTPDGQVLMPGHVGSVYQASNARYTGRGTARTLTVLPDGTVLPDRAAQKVRAAERGAGHVIRRLVALGADGPGAGETGAQWLARALTQLGVRKVRHRGNHRFVWALGDRAQRRHVPIALASLPYPKVPDPAIAWQKPSALC